MPLYEVMFIVQPDWEGEALEEAILRVKDVIEREKGTVVLLKKLGKRRLAYEINDFREGSYVLLNVQASREVIPVLEHFFKVNEGYLRYIVIRLEKGELEEKIANVPAENVPAEEVDAEKVPAENVSAEKVVAGSAPVEKDDAGNEADGTPEVQDEEPGEE